MCLLTQPWSDNFLQLQEQWGLPLIQGADAYAPVFYVLTKS